MKVVKIFSVNEQVEHVVALTTDLETHLHPVKGCCLKELGGFERSEQISEKDRNIFTSVFSPGFCLGESQGPLF